MIEYVTSELARSKISPDQVTVWFETTEGKIHIRMSKDGLIQLQGLVSNAVGQMAVDSTNAMRTVQAVEAGPRGSGIG